MTPNLKEAFVKTIYTLTGLIYTSAPLQDCSLSSGSLTGQRSWLCKMMYQMISHTRVVKPPEKFLNNKSYLPIALTLIPYLYVSLAFHRIVFTCTAQLHLIYARIALKSKTMHSTQLWRYDATFSLFKALMMVIEMVMVMVMVMKVVRQCTRL